MAGAVIRDADDMVKFANELNEYEQGVKSLCDRLMGQIENAEQFMKDQNSVRALQSIAETVYAVKNEVPDCSELADRLKKSAGHVRDASETVRRI